MVSEEFLMQRTYDKSAGMDLKSRITSSDLHNFVFCFGKSKTRTFCSGMIF